MKVIFPKEDVHVQPTAFSTVPISVGDYVLVKILSANSQSLRGRALSLTSLRAREVHCRTPPEDQRDEHVAHTQP
uniref:CDK5 regulatory subunit-associated protein 1 n=1 Tax=Maylandia zebra TaxID=106582 RepID=UPI000D2FA2F4|nr:CDK5 regulatory subunit-associated protein 1-like [Maylandia zebra]